MAETDENRCRLILALPALEQPAKHIAEALSGGDVAAVFIDAGVLDEPLFKQHCEQVVPIIQDCGAAAIVVGHTAVGESVQADGFLINSNLDEFKQTIARFSPHKIVGYGGARTRHAALEAGEFNPDFVFFGRVGMDIRPQPHRKNLTLANWWAQIVEIPCAVMGGDVIESAKEVAISGAEFVVLGRAVFFAEEGAASAVARTNGLLDEFAPKFDAE